MNETIKHCLTAGLAAALCLLLAGCGDKVEPPEAYAVGENSTVPLDSYLDEEEGGKLTAIDAPESEEEEDGEEKKDEEAEQLSESTGGEEEGSEGGDAYTYTYEEVPAAALERYAAALTAEEEGFRVIDEERAPQPDLPAFDGEEGSATFAREAVEENTLFQIAINWTAEACTVTVSCEEGGFYSEEEEAAEESQESSMTLNETIDYFYGLPPAALGLEGENMSEYTLLPGNGDSLVDGALCRHMNLYRTDPVAGTNVIIGAYLIGDRNIYKLDKIANTVELVYPKSLSST